MYSSSSKISEHWLYTENLILIDKNLLSGKWNLAKFHIERLASINIQQALLQLVNNFLILKIYLKKFIQGKIVKNNEPLYLYFIRSHLNRK